MDYQKLDDVAAAHPEQLTRDDLRRMTAEAICEAVAAGRTEGIGGPPAITGDEPEYEPAPFVIWKSGGTVIRYGGFTEAHARGLIREWDRKVPKGMYRGRRSASRRAGRPRIRRLRAARGSPRPRRSSEDEEPAARLCRWLAALLTILRRVAR